MSNYLAFEEPLAKIEEEIAKANFPGAVVLVCQKDDIVYWQAFGNKIIDPCEETADRNTIYDLASMTKPIALLVY